jgi:hypothetical protein
MIIFILTLKLTSKEQGGHNLSVTGQSFDEGGRVITLGSVKGRVFLKNLNYYFIINNHPAPCS